MIITYLEKIRDRYLEEKVDINGQLTEAMIIKKENIEFIKLLEQNNDTSFEAFTPRTINTFSKKKIGELKEEQVVLENKIDTLKSQLEQIESEIAEVTIVIKEAKEKLL